MQRGSSSAAGGIGAIVAGCLAACYMGERVGREAIGALHLAFVLFAASGERFLLFAAGVAAAGVAARLNRMRGMRAVRGS